MRNFAYTITKQCLTPLPLRVMKTINETINEIKNAKISNAAKRVALAELGLLKYEVDMVMKSITKPGGVAKGRFTFGCEIECYVEKGRMLDEANNAGLNVQYESYNHVDGHAYYKFVRDASLDSRDDAIECVSPILTGVNGKASLRNMCLALNRAGASVNRACGLHVHIGAKNITDSQYVNTFVNYLMLEPLIDSFMAPSRRNNTYAESLVEHAEPLKACNTPNDVYYNALHMSRYHKVNPASWRTHKTIEFRQHGGTTDFDKISNWVAFCGKLVLWSKSNRLERYVESIDDVPFLTDKEKAYFKSRQEVFAPVHAEIA